MHQVKHRKRMYVGDELTASVQYNAHAAMCSFRIPSTCQGIPQVTGSPGPFNMFIAHWSAVGLQMAQRRLTRRISVALTMI